MKNPNFIFRPIIGMAWLFLFPFVAMAQELQTATIEPFYLDESHTSLRQKGNLARMVQVGDQNISWAQQQGENTLQMSQRGFSNSNFSKQEGIQNQITLTQIGNFNESNLQVFGSNTHIYSLQTGDENQLVAKIENRSETRHYSSFTQQGRGNQIDLTLIGEGAPASMIPRIEVSQQGQGHVLNGVLDSYHSPISVTQTAGAGGAGMRLNISSSAFGLPRQ
jgi:hypothetical protein